jgi:uncharacterized protein
LLMLMLEDKQERLRSLVRSFDSCVIAYSGGVDSALVAQVAFWELGSRALAVTGVSPSLASTELAGAMELARSIGIPHQTLATEEIHQDEYRRNDARRCFHCKNELYSRMRELADRLGFAVIANGTNADDLGDYRPGIEAGTRWNVRSPLAEVQLSKQEVRELARWSSLAVAEKPASPCLSSRISYGEEVTVARLRMIERAEEFLRALGCSTVRVRYHSGDVARIEIEPVAVGLVMEDRNRRALIDCFRQLGFRFITLDLEGFRSGSLNALLEEGGSLPIIEGDRRKFLP